MDSLYTNFLRYPTLIHANSKPSHYEHEMKWRFYNEGYADFRYGAFVPRWKVQTFLTQLGKSGLIKDSLRQAESYFSIWTNQYPWLLSNPPQTPKGIKASDADIAYPEPLDKYTYDAIRHLQRSLESDRSDSPQDYFDREEEQPSLEHRDVRASCANDKCLFMTNMDPFVPPSQVTFDYKQVNTIPQLENLYETISEIPHGIEWDQSSYQRVVDQDPHTCWNTLKGPQEGDYFGLLFVGSLRIEKLIIYTPQEIKRVDRQMVVTAMESDNEWVTCKITDRTTPSSGKLTLDLYCPGAQYYRAMKVTFIKTMHEPFELCGLTINTFSV
ncbi:hypothetical protein BDB01DRAFT_716216 [Pilobolus umbonatus]|nr:hypothetical protein BDB01DRAFT_716216 [Pilobolus umbonatus]